MGAREGRAGGASAPGITAEDVRALARSSPWRFTTLHWTHREHGGPEVEAWLHRPWRLVVRFTDPDISAEPVVLEEQGPPYSSSAWSTRPQQPPAEVEPVRREDGLVLRRPTSLEVDYDDPIHGTFRWVPMLDPAELADGREPGRVGVELTEVHEGQRRGRLTWWATARPTEHYAARCAGCCDLLPTRLTQEMEAARGGYDLGEELLAGLPTAYLVGLDVQTGIVVDVTPLDGDAPTSRFTNEIHAVDTELDPPPVTGWPPSPWLAGG